MKKVVIAACLFSFFISCTKKEDGPKCYTCAVFQNGVNPKVDTSVICNLSESEIQYRIALLKSMNTTMNCW